MSEKQDDGGPAFPSDPVFTPDGQQACGGHYGMTLLDWFAGQALAGICTTEHWIDITNTQAAREAYEAAAAMLSEKRRRSSPAPAAQEEGNDGE